MAEERVVKSVRMTPDLVARVEAARGDVVWSTWVVRAVEQRLEREGLDEARRQMTSAVVEEAMVQKGRMNLLDPAGETMVRDARDYAADGVAAANRQLSGPVVSGHTAWCDCSRCEKKRAKLG